jgi:phage gp36-like protein
MAVHVYITPQQVRDRMFTGTQDRLASLLNLEVGQDPLTSTQLARALEDAHAEVDSFVLARYPQPFSIIPPLLTSLAFELVKYRLLQARSDLISELDRASYEDALRSLREIADGRRQLAFPPVNQTESLVQARQVPVGTRNSDGTESDFRRVLRAF